MTSFPKTTPSSRQSVHPPGPMATVCSVDPGAPARVGSLLGQSHATLVSSKHRLPLDPHLYGTGTCLSIELTSALYLIVLYGYADLSCISQFSSSSLIDTVSQVSHSRFVAARFSLVVFRS